MMFPQQTARPQSNTMEPEAPTALLESPKPATLAEEIAGIRESSPNIAELLEWAHNARLKYFGG